MISPHCLLKIGKLFNGTHALPYEKSLVFDSHINNINDEKMNIKLMFPCNLN